MTFKEFMSSTYRMPARILRAYVGLVLGDRVRIKGNYDIDLMVESPSTLGLILDAGKALLNFVKRIGQGITGFLRSQEQTIANAFWLSLLLGTAAALTVAYLPAALTFVVNFNIAGYSIASLVGTDFAAQVAATAGLTALATSAVVYSTALVTGIAGFIKSCFSRGASAANEAEPDFGQEVSCSTGVALNSLDTHVKAAPVVSNQSATNPVHHASPLQQFNGVAQDDDLNETVYTPIVLK